MSLIIAERRELVVAKTKVYQAPSKLRYRLERLWLTWWIRSLVRVWLPVLALMLAGYAAWLSPAVNAWAASQVSAVRDSVAARPEWQIDRVSVPVGSPDIERQILAVMNLQLPVSALDVDLVRLHRLVQGLNAVKSASVRFLESGVLEVTIVERMPGLVWRDQNRIYLLDENGVMVAEVPRRSVRFDLPLVVGEGANAAIVEARELFSVLAPLEGKVLGLVRMGERRWDVVLENTVIMLPAEGGSNALREVMAMQAKDRALDLNISVIDMRDANRTIIRLNQSAIEALRLSRARLNGERV